MRWDHLRLDDALPGLGQDAGAATSGAACGPGCGDGASTAGVAGTGGDAPAPLPLFGRNTVTRTFDTPAFRGMTFYEVQAKSIVNRVPESSRMPFTWTINPYRGCQHACAYCAAGETPILMADGRTKPLAKVRVGDAIYGTVRSGFYRRYAIT
ncbi:MAG TPA: hypothetical protein VGN41_12700, partial [Streptosporangiaceae bacterium]